MNGKRENTLIAGEDRCRSIAVVHVAIDHHRARDRVVALQFPDRDCDVVNGAKALAMVREGMMETAAQIERHAVAQCLSRGQDGPARRQPERPDHFLRPRNFQRH